MLVGIRMGGFNYTWADHYCSRPALRPNFASYVTRQRPQTLEQLTEAARVAELTTAENDQFTEVKTEIRKLHGS